jgi:hypothetical protein
MPTHLLDAQRKAKKARVKDEKIRANLGFSPLKTRVKSTSSLITPKSSKASTYVASPAVQKSKSSDSKLKKLTTSNTKSFNSEYKEKLIFFDLPSDIRSKIYKRRFYQNEYVLREWIDYNKLDLKELAKNLNSISYFDKKFKENPDDKEIDWYWLSGNPNAIELIKKKLLYEKNQDRKVLKLTKKVNWGKLSANLNAIELLEQKLKEEKASSPESFREMYNDDKISWDELSKNPNAIELLKKYRQKTLGSIFLNKNMDTELITSILADNEKNGWYIVWTIPKIIRVLLRRFPNEIDYKQLSQNTSYKAIKLLTVKSVVPVTCS